MHSTRRCHRRPASGGLRVLLCAAAVLPGIGAASPLPTAAQTVELRWKLAAGTDLVYRHAMQSETELPEGLGTLTMRSESTQRWSVLEVDGDATIRVTTERVQMRLDGPMGTTSADSADPDSSGTFLDAVREMDGVSYTVVLDPRGAIVEMSGLEEMRQALRGQMADPSGQAILDSMLSDEALHGQWGLGALLPVDAVGVGSTWDSTSTSPVPAFGSMTAATSYEVESMDGDLVVIRSSETMSLSDSAAASPVPMPLGDITVVTISNFDAGRGLLLGTESTIRLQASMAIAGQETVLDTATTMTLELVEGQ